MATNNVGGEEQLQKMAELSKTLKEEGRILAPTRRPDGTLRKPIRIRAGYVPQEEVAIYQSKGALWKKEMASQVVPPGYDPPADEKLKTKSAKRNEQKKEKRLQAALEKGNLEGVADVETKREDVPGEDLDGSKSVKSLTSQMSDLAFSPNPVSTSSPSNTVEASDAGAPVLDLDKKIQALKNMVVSPSEKSRPKVGQQLHPSLSFSSTHGGTSKSDSQKVSNESRLLILKPSRESIGVSSITTRDNLSPTNGSNKFANSPINITPSAAASASFRRSGNSPRLATAERNQTPLWMTMEKRETAKAQSRNDFFSLLKKSASNSAFSVLDSGSAVSPLVSEMPDELCTEDSCTSVTLQDGGVPSSEISIADLPTDNRSEVALNGDAYAESQHSSSNGDGHSRPDAYLCPDEKEAALLRSLGWEKNAEDDGLTEKEISAFFEQLMQSLSPLNSQNGTHGDALSGSSSMDSNGVVWTC